MNNLQLLFSIVASTFIPTLAVIVAMIHSNGRFASIERGLDSLEHHMDARFTSVETRLAVIEADMRRFWEILVRHDVEIQTLKERK